MFGALVGAFTSITFGPQVGRRHRHHPRLPHLGRADGPRRLPDRHRHGGPQGPVHADQTIETSKETLEWLTETDAARERVLAARGQLGDELALLEASARAAVDIPAKVKASPAKAAAVAGTAGFLVLGGPRRVFGGVKRAVRGPERPAAQVDAARRDREDPQDLGDDGDAVRGALERDFADYAKKAAKSRNQLRTVLALSVARPLLSSGAKAAAGWLFSSGEEQGFDERLASVRERLEKAAGQKAGGAARVPPPAATKPKTGSLRDDAEDVSGA